MFRLFGKGISSSTSSSLSKLEGLRLLCIADTHRVLNPSELGILESYRDKVDLVLTLGDIPVESLSKINGDYGVLGNHDYFGGIEIEKNLHLRTINHPTQSSHPTPHLHLSLGGFEGSSRYKPGRFVMYSQPER